jgi:ribosome-binding factor A
MDDRRIRKINDLLQEEIGWLITTELKDPRLSLLLSVTKVIANKDLKSAKIMISVMGSIDEQQNALKALNDASGYIYNELKSRVRLRYLPYLKFLLDDSIEAMVNLPNTTK